MLIKVIALVAVMLVFGVSSFIRSPGSFVTSVKDQEEEAARWQGALLLEKQIINWYYQHNGTFPVSLNADVLHKMGVSTDTLAYVSYWKSDSGRLFYVRLGDLNSTYKFTPRSAVPLPEI